MYLEVSEGSPLSIPSMSNCSKPTQNPVFEPRTSRCFPSSFCTRSSTLYYSPFFWFCLFCFQFLIFFHCLLFPIAWCIACHYPTSFFSASPLFSSLHQPSLSSTYRSYFSTYSSCSIIRPHLSCFSPYRHGSSLLSLSQQQLCVKQPGGQTIILNQMTFCCPEHMGLEWKRDGCHHFRVA